VWVRARILSSRAKGKSCFLVLREGCFTAQACMFAGDAIPAEMVKYTGKLPVESVVDVFGTITKVEKPIESCTQTLVELSINKLFCVSLAASRTPFLVADAARSDVDIAAAEAKGDKMVRVNLDTRLDNRVLDLRTPANNSIFKMQSAVGNYFREYFLMNDFIEIHSPKIIPGVSEGGANVFKLGYFGGEACLAQSPQLYKQMAVLGDLSRVFEIGPVFRAEDSNTHRHLCEFVGLDFEMEIKEHYHEVLDALGNAFIHIFDRINERMQAELSIIAKQHPFEPLKYLRKTLVIHHEEAVQMLREAGEPIGELDDFSTPQEKLLGKLVRDKYDTDFYIVDKYPLSVRPFYTMPHPEDPRYSNSYDVFVRGEEITSGAQRLHDYNMLIQRATECKIPIASLQTYLDAFKYGAQPHGGAGIGLERVVMLFLALGNIRKSSLFPRDPKRCAP
jgi:aspartyl-tRNA synthetase